MPLTLEPLDAPLGAQVHGFDFSSPLDPRTFGVLRDWLDEHLLLLFRNGAHPPGPDEVVALCSAFGELQPTLADRSRLPEHPGINLVSNRVLDGVQGTGSNGTVTWHSDLRFSPPLIEILYLDALAVTSTGGNTKWTNLRAAYDALDPELAGRLDAMSVRYGLRTDLDFGGYFKASGELALSSTEISLVQVNPRTGAKALWPNLGPDFTAEVVGLPPADGAALLEMLYRHCTQDRFVYTHRWEVGDAFLWLNNQTMHEREAFPDDETRCLRHVNILGAADPRQRTCVPA